jgi:hypothetical protein
MLSKVNKATNANANHNIDEHRKLFYSRLATLNHNVMQKQKLTHMISLLTGKSVQKSKEFYRIKGKYSVLMVGEEEVLINKELNKEFSKPAGIELSKVRKIIGLEDAFDEINDAHTNGGHCQGEKTYKLICERVSNIPRSFCVLFCALCFCSLNKKTSLKPERIKPILSTTLNSRGQVNLSRIHVIVRNKSITFSLSSLVRSY